MFKKARQLMTAAQLKTVGARMMERKQELLSQKDSLLTEAMDAVHTAAHSVIGMASAGNRQARGAENMAANSTRH